MPRNKELERLKGLNEISEEERTKFMLDNADKLKAYSHYPKLRDQAASIIYNNQKFIKEFGEDAFNTPDKNTEEAYNRRNQMFRNKIVNKAFNNAFAKADDYMYLNNALDIQAKEDLLNNSDYYGAIQRNKLFQEETAQSKIKAQKLEREKEARGAFMQGINSTDNAIMLHMHTQENLDNAITPSKKLADRIKSDTEIVEKLSVETQERRESEIQPIADYLYADILEKDRTDGKSIADNLKAFEKLALSASNHYKAFKNENDLADYSNTDKLKDLAKTQALAAKYGESIALTYLDRTIQNRVAKYQDGRWTGNTLKGIFTTTVSDLGSDVALIANAPYMFDVDTRAAAIQGKDPSKPVYDEEGNIIDYETNDNLFTNLAYWNNVQKYNVFSPTEITAIEERGGISSDINIREYGHIPEFFSWETAQEAAKQTGHVAAQIVESYLLGSAGKAVGLGAKSLLNTAGVSSKFLNAAGKVAGKINNAIVYASSGVNPSHLESMGTFEEQLQHNKDRIDDQIKSELQDYINSYDFESEEAIQGINNKIKELKTEYKEEAAKKAKEGKGNIIIPSDDMLKEIATQAYTNDLLATKEKELVELHKQDLKEAERSASLAYKAGFALDYIKEVPLNYFIERYKFAKGSLVKVENNALKNLLVSDMKTGGIKVAEEAGKKTARKNAKELGKTALKQIAGGFTDEYLDGINSSFGQGFGSNVFDNYLNKTYNSEVYNETIDNFIGNVLLGVSEAANGITSRNNLYEGFIGAVSPISMVNPNISAIFHPSSAYKAFAKGEGDINIDGKPDKLSWTERIDAILVNPIIHELAENKSNGRYANKVADVINKEIADRKDELLKITEVIGNFKEGESSGINEVKAEDESLTLLDTKDNKFLQAFSLINTLSQLQNIPGIDVSPLYANTVNTMKGLANGTLSEEELNKEIDKFIADPHNEEYIDYLFNREIAVERLQKNAQYFMNMMDKYEKTAELINKSPVLKNASNGFKTLFTYNLLASDDYKDRIQIIEKELDLSSTNADDLYTPNLAIRYGSRKAREMAIESRKRQINDIKKDLNEIDKYNSDIIAQIQDAEEKLKITTKDVEIAAIKKQIEQLNNLKETIGIQHNTVLIQQKAVEDEIETLEDLLTNNTNAKFTEQEILSLDARDRAAVLDKNNIDNYSTKQKVIINHTIANLKKKDPTAIDKIIDAGTLAQRVDDLNKAFELLNDKSKLASTFIESVEHKRDKNAFFDRLQRGINKHYSEIDGAFTKKGYDRGKMRRATLAAGVPVLKAYMEDNPDKVSIVEPYYDIQVTSSDIASILTYESMAGNLRPQVYTSMLDRIYSLQQSSDTKRDFLDKIEAIIDSPTSTTEEISNYEKLLKKLERLNYTRNATILDNREKGKKREEELQRQREEAAKQEQQKRAKAEEAAKKASADITSKDETDVGVPDNVPSEDTLVTSSEEAPKGKTSSDAEKAFNGGQDGTQQVEINPNHNVNNAEQTGEPVDVDLGEEARWGAQGLLEDDADGLEVSKGKMFDDNTDSSKEGNFVVKRNGNTITFINDDKEESLSISFNEYENSDNNTASDKSEEIKNSEHKLTTILQWLQGKISKEEVDKLNLRKSNIPGNGELDEIVRKYLEETFPDIIINTEDNNTSTAGGTPSPTIYTVKDKEGNSLGSPSDALRNYYEELSGKREGTKYQDALGKPVETTTDNNQENSALPEKEAPSFIATSMEKIGNNWYFNGNFAGQTEKTRVKATKDFNLDTAIDRQKNSRKSSALVEKNNVQSPTVIKNGEDVVVVSEDAVSEAMEIKATDKNNTVQVLSLSASLDIPSEESTSNDSTRSSERLSGTGMYKYDSESLVQRETLVDRKGRASDDTMNRFFAWMESAGHKLQQVVDTELWKILKNNPNAIVKFMVVNSDKSTATHDEHMKNHLMLVLDYDNAINKDIEDIHNPDNGCVIISNGKKYLIIGVAGYNKIYPEQQKLYDNAKHAAHEGKSLIARSQHFFRDNKGERFYVDDIVTTQIVPRSLTQGYIVKEIEGQDKKRDEIVPVSSLLPNGMKLSDLAWEIVTGSSIVSINSGNRMVKEPINRGENIGRTFVLIPAGNGDLIPAAIRPTKYQDIKEGDLYNKIQDLLYKLASPSSRVGAVVELSKIFHFTKGGDDLILSKNGISIKINGIENPTFYPLRSSEDRNRFIEAFKSFNPTINLSVRSLSSPSNLRMLDEAGVLITDIAQLHTSGSTYEIYGIDKSGNMITPSSPINTENWSRTKEVNRRQIIYNGKTYFVENSNYTTDSGELVTDAKILDDLKYNELVIEGKAIKCETRKTESLYIYDGKVFSVSRNSKKVTVFNEEESATYIENYKKEMENSKKEETALEELKVGEAIPIDDISVSVDEATGEITGGIIGIESSDETKDNLKETKEKGETSAESKPLNSNPSSDESNSIKDSLDNTTQNFAELISGENFDRVYEAISDKWSDAPTKISELSEFLKNKGIEIENIGTTQADIDAWIDTLINCR